MIEKRVDKIPSRLIHLSEVNHDGEIFRPRIPESIATHENEDDKVKRVCFSGSISGAFRAIDFYGYYHNFYVHVPVGIEDIVRRGKLCKPTIKQVYDVESTDEYWIKCNVKLKCIGVVCFQDRNYHSYSDSIRFRWLEKFA